MKIEKREVKTNKTYRSTNREFGSHNDVISELDSLLTRLNNRIDEQSNKMRKQEDGQKTGDINQMNKLKLHRTNVQYIKKTLQTYDDDSWRDMLPEIEYAFSKAEEIAVMETQ